MLTRIPTLRWLRERSCAVQSLSNICKNIFDESARQQSHQITTVHTYNTLCCAGGTSANVIVSAHTHIHTYILHTYIHTHIIHKCIHTYYINTYIHTHTRHRRVSVHSYMPTHVSRESAQKTHEVVPTLRRLRRMYLIMCTCM